MNPEYKLGLQTEAPPDENTTRCAWVVEGDQSLRVTQTPPLRSCAVLRRLRPLPRALTFSVTADLRLFL